MPRSIAEDGFLFLGGHFEIELNIGPPTPKATTVKCHNWPFNRGGREGVLLHESSWINSS